MPVHGLPADPRRRLRPGSAAARRRPSWRPASLTRAPPVVTGDLRRARRAASTSDPGHPRRDPALLAERPDARAGRRLDRLGRRREPARWHRAIYVLVAIDRSRSCAVWTTTEDHVEIGAALTLTEIERRLSGRIPLLAEMFPQFASRLIRNGATLGGNLGTGSPIGDTPPALLALEASLVLAGAAGRAGLCRWPTTSPGTVAPCRESGRADPRPSGIPLPLAAIRRVPQDRQAPVRRHLQCGRGVRARHRRRRRASGPHRPGRRRRHPDARPGDRTGPGGQPWSTGDRARARRRRPRATGTPLDDHRASSRYRHRDASAPPC